MNGPFHKSNMKRLMAKGMTEQEAELECKRIHEIALKVPCDFGPDWIDSPETIRQHFKDHPEELEC